MISKSLNKNFSIVEHRDRIISKFKYSKELTLNFFNIQIENVKKKERFYFKEISEREFDKLNFIFEKENTNIYKGSILNDLVDFSFIDKDPHNLMLADSTLENPFIREDKLEIKEKLIVKESLFEETLLIDTTLFFTFLINKKTANNFSRLVVMEGKNVYLMKRKKTFLLFMLDIT